MRYVAIGIWWMVVLCVGGGAVYYTEHASREAVINVELDTYSTIFRLTNDRNAVVYTSQVDVRVDSGLDGTYVNLRQPGFFFETSYNAATIYVRTAAEKKRYESYLKQAEEKRNYQPPIQSPRDVDPVVKISRLTQPVFLLS